MDSTCYCTYNLHMTLFLKIENVLHVIPIIDATSDDTYLMAKVMLVWTQRQF